MVRAKLLLDRFAVVPDRPLLGAPVVVLVADPAAAALVELVADDQAFVVFVRIVIAGRDLAARCQFGLEVGFCANHRSLPSLIAGEFRALAPSPTPHSAPGAEPGRDGWLPGGPACG